MFPSLRLTAANGIALRHFVSASSQERLRYRARQPDQRHSWSGKYTEPLNHQGAVVTYVFVASTGSSRSRSALGHDAVSRDLQVRAFVSAGKTKLKQNTGSRFLRVPYAILTNSLCSLGAMREKSKLKNQMAQIEEINIDPYK
jgi:hypothetical protein